MKRVLVLGATLVALTGLALTIGATQPVRGALAGADSGATTASTALTWGDLDCSGAIDGSDAIDDLKAYNGLNPAQTPSGCPPLGGDFAVGPVTWKWGDVNCSGAIDPLDSLAELQAGSGLTVTQTTTGCPAFGAPVGSAVILDGDVVSSIGGEQLMVTHTSGDDMLAASSQWVDYFSTIGAQSSSVLTSTSTPAPDSALHFRMTAIKAPGADWTDLLAQYTAGIQAHAESGLVASQETLGGKSVWHVTVPGQPEYSTYYYGGGDTLHLIGSDDANLAAAAFATLPATTSGESPAQPLTDNPPVPGSNPLVLTPIRAIIPPVCVAEPFGRVRLDLMAIDTGYAIPIVANFFATGILDGETRPTTDAGPIATFYYRATMFSNQQENIQLQAIAPAGGTGTSSFQFPVQHCLNGTWQDAQRVLQMDHHVTDITANIQSGTLCDEEGGVAFSGTLEPATYQFSGSDLKVCNPDDCVQAGLEPVSTTVDYSAEIALDGNSISFSWKSEDIDRTYDNNDHLQSCTFNGGYSDHSFSIDRLTFGPAVPY